MSVSESISAAMDAIATKKERLQKVYGELESHTSALVNFKIQWKDLQDHFDTLEELMKKRSEELGVKVIEIKTTKPKAVVPGSSPASAKKTAGKTAEKTGEKLTEKEVKPRAEYRTLCEKMDAEGLLKFLVDNKKDLKALRSEAPGALKAAPKPAELVLKALEGFHTEGKKSEKEFSLFMQRRRAGVLLLETLPAVVKAEDVPVEVKKLARKMAVEWKANTKTGEGSYLEAHAFLQLLFSYGLASEYRDDHILEDFVVAIANRKQAPELCRNLGLADKMPGNFLTPIL